MCGVRGRPAGSEPGEPGSLGVGGCGAAALPFLALPVKPITEAPPGGSPYPWPEMDPPEGGCLREAGQGGEGA